MGKAVLESIGSMREVDVGKIIGSVTTVGLFNAVGSIKVV